ncbi:MAG: tetratricopeptide repeat protein [Magnetococcales bacterium]|nr:tetratricopeptide repeat protein [Magnetococcales bacterium]
MEEMREWIRRGLEHLEANRLEEAGAAFDAALAGAPDEPELLALAAQVAHRRGEHGRAVAWFGRALAACPQRADWHAGLGQALRAMGRSAPALERLREAVRLDPAHPDLRLNLGVALQEAGRVEEALEHYRAAIALDPRLAAAHYDMGGACQALGRFQEAEAAYRETIRLLPDHFRAHYNLGMVLSNDGRDEEGRAAFGAAWRISPGYARARWKMLLDLPVLVMEEGHIAPMRARWRDGVRQLLETPLVTPGEIREAWEAASAVSHFYLNYHDRNDIEEQKLYGRLLTRVAAAAFPACAQPLARRPAGEKLRVGFVSSFLYGHSIFKTHARWITGLDAHRCVFYTGTVQDVSVQFVAERVEWFRQFPPSLPASELIEAIVRARLDVLIYTDLGMDPRLHPLSALRLAPVQCNGGGHPVTSGVAAIDLFFSSALMEPENGQEHYSERLVRLPNLASCYPRPKTAMARLPEGWQPGRVNYVNLQSLFKLLPQHDEVYPRIAREVPGSRFFFIEVTGCVAERFRERLQRAFARFGMDAGEYCRLLPRMGQDAFFGLAREADVILDGIAWSGNNSSLEALAFDVPIVTLAGRFFRSRHTLGILRRIGVEETVARDLDHFVELAVRLGLERGLRDEISARIASRKALLYEDESVPQALGECLIRLANGLEIC